MANKVSESRSRSGVRLQSYKHPPVNEVVCGLKFQPPEKFTLPYFGLLWEKVRADYPTIQHAPPIARGLNDFLVDSATGTPLPRVWFVNGNDNQLIQFQVDRLYFNWRQRGDTYPRYPHVIKEWARVIDTTEQFFEENGFGKVRIMECELTYINHIKAGQGWQHAGDISGIVRDIVWKNSERFLPSPTDVHWGATFPLPDDKGTLNASIQTARLATDKQPVLILNLTARGIGRSTDRLGIREWFDTAHEWIVCGFADLTTEKAQKEIWEREDA
jgi:uncharacterized protein (TIGR04255 family)